jgi:hypothetical protein
MIVSPHRGHLRRLGLALLLAVAAVVPAAFGATQDVFEVDNVKVDVTAENASAARERALADGQAKAFRMLLERLVMTQDTSRLPAFRPADVTALVRDFSVADEKTSSVRYLASLSFRFRPEDVRRYLIDLGLPFAETRSKPVLVLPIYQASGTLLLWDDPNPWRQAWAARPEATSGLIPLLLPGGDLTDVATIGAEQADAGDVQRLAAVAGRYGAEDTLVARADMGLSARTGRPELTVTVTRYGPSGNPQPLTMTYSAGETEDTDTLLRRAAIDVTRQVENNWKRDNLMQFGNESILAVTLPVRSLADWTEAQKRLAGVAVVRRIDLVMMSRDEVRLNLHFLGEDEQLVLALRQADLDLQISGDEAALKLAGVATRK